VPDQGTTVTIMLPLAKGTRTDRDVDAEGDRAPVSDATPLPAGDHEGRPYG